jgi:ABC-2 type transport system ATP-binding protein
MLETKQLTKVYEDGVTALHELTLHVSPGEVYALLGANGAGKSTTINLILGLIPPTSGDVFIDGISIGHKPESAKRHVGYIPEQVALYGDLDARQNLRYLVELHGRRLDSGDADAALEQVGLPREALGRRARLLSKGMRQKVAIAAVRAAGARLLLLDEPTSGLDPRASSEFSALLERLRAEGTAVFMATHDLFRTSRLADRVGIMREGRLETELDRRDLEKRDLESLYLDIVADPPAA